MPHHDDAFNTTKLRSDVYTNIRSVALVKGIVVHDFLTFIVLDAIQDKARIDRAVQRSRVALYERRQRMSKRAGRKRA